MSSLCKLNFPLYSCQTLDDTAFLVAGGGGAAKTGVPNIIQVLELHKEKQCTAHPVDQLDTGKHAVMNMSVQAISSEPSEPHRCGLLAIGLGSQCNVYSIKKHDKPKDENQGVQEQASRRKKASGDNNKKTNRLFQGVTSYAFEVLHEIESVPDKKGFQTSVRISKDGSFIVTGGSDGHVRAWKLKNSKCTFDTGGHKDDVTDIDISPDGKQVVSASRDGTAFLWDSSNGHKLLELHSLWNMQMLSRSYRFRNCRFAVVPEDPSRFVLFTSHAPMKQDPKKKSNVCCLTKWAKQRSKEGTYVGELKPAVVQRTGSEAISSMAVSPNGVFVAVGFMEGSVGIYIAFSLQCATRVKNVHNMFVTSLSFVNDTEKTRALTGDCDAAVISVSAISTCRLTKLRSRTMFPFWVVIVLCIFAIVVSAFYLQSVGFL